MVVKEIQSRDYYSRRLAQLNEELAAVEIDLESAPRQIDKLKLGREAKRILAEMDEIEQMLLGLDSIVPEKNVRETNLEKILQKINFSEAKRTASLIEKNLNKDGGSALFLLRKSKKQMGHYCVEEVINVLMSDQLIDGQIIGAYRRIPIDLDSPISQYNEKEFLIRLASYLGVEESNDLIVLLQKIRKKICNSIDCGTTIFLEIRGLDDLLEKENFLVWFIEEFWQPLIDEVLTISKKYRSKFIVALIADSYIMPDCSLDYFCDGESFDCYKILELPLPDWTVKDIHDWLIRFHTVSVCMKNRTIEDLQKIAKKIYRESEGTPQSVCVSLREQFL